MNESYDKEIHGLSIFEAKTVYEWISFHEM